MNFRVLASERLSPPSQSPACERLCPACPCSQPNGLPLALLKSRPAGKSQSQPPFVRLLRSCRCIVAIASLQASGSFGPRLSLQATALTRQLKHFDCAKSDATAGSGPTPYDSPHLQDTVKPGFNGLFGRASIGFGPPYIHVGHSLSLILHVATSQHKLLAAARQQLTAVSNRQAAPIARWWPFSVRRCRGVAAADRHNSVGGLEITLLSPLVSARGRDPPRDSLSRPLMLAIHQPIRVSRTDGHLGALTTASSR